MENSGGIQASLAGRYAKALFDLALEREALDSVATSVIKIKTALSESPDFQALTTNPMISRLGASKAVGGVAKLLALDPLATNFLRTLATNGRLHQLAAIIVAFNTLTASHRGEITAQVTSAHPLQSDQLAAIGANLTARIGKKVAIEALVNPDILGGLLVKIGSQMIDSSISTKLNTLALAMKG